MRARGTLILLVLCAALGGFILWFERDRPTPEEREEQARVILDLDPAAITGIRLAWRESTLAVERRDRKDRWRLIEPRAAAADQEAVGALAAMFDELKAERWLEPGDTDLAAAGLAEPWVRVMVTAGDSIRHELAVGDLNPTRSAYFARLDSDARIALLTSWLADSNLKRTFSSLREKRLASFDPEAARRVELITSTGRRELIQEDGAWRIADPPLAADETAVRSLLSQLNQIEAIEFVDEAGAPEEEGAHGLATPRLVATVTGDGDSVLARIEIGARGPSGCYARSITQPAIVTVPFTIERDLTLDVDELRDQRLVALGGSEIDTLEVTAGPSRAVLARDSSGVFVRISEKDASAGDPEANRVAANLPHVRVTRFVHDRAATPAELRRYGLDPPSVRLGLRLRNGEHLEVAFGRATAEGVYAYRPQTGVVLVEEQTVDDLRRLAAPGGGGNHRGSGGPGEPLTGNSPP